LTSYGLLPPSVPTRPAQKSRHTCTSAILRHPHIPISCVSFQRIPTRAVPANLVLGTRLDGYRERGVDSLSTRSLSSTPSQPKHPVLREVLRKLCRARRASPQPESNLHLIVKASPESCPYKHEMRMYTSYEYVGVLWSGRTDTDSGDNQFKTKVLNQTR